MSRYCPKEVLEARQSIYASCCKETRRTEIIAILALKKFYELAEEIRKPRIEEGSSVPWDETWVDDAWRGNTQLIKAWINAWKAAILALNEWCHAASSEGVALKAADSWRYLDGPRPEIAAEEARKHHAEDPIWDSARVAKEREDREWSADYKRVCYPLEVHFQQFNE